MEWLNVPDVSSPRRPSASWGPSDCWRRNPPSGSCRRRSADISKSIAGNALASSPVINGSSQRPIWLGPRSACASGVSFSNAFSAVSLLCLFAFQRASHLSSATDVGIASGEPSAVKRSCLVAASNESCIPLRERVCRPDIDNVLGGALRGP